MGWGRERIRAAMETKKKDINQQVFAYGGHKKVSDYTVIGDEKEYL